MSIIAKAPTSTVQLMVQLADGKGNAHPLLQKFPTTAAPRVGERIVIESGQYEVTQVGHVFNVSAENRHTIVVDVKQTA